MPTANFTHAEDVTEFTFKDGGKEMKATFADDTWTIIAAVDASVVLDMNLRKVINENWE